MNADLKGDAYEGLIEKTAQEGARGAGQHFTPRALISAIVDVMQPGPDDRICDFYAQGAKANVLFFRRRPGAEAAWTRELWVYDLRTNKHFTRKQNPLRRSDLDDFVACSRPGEVHRRQESERFKRFTYEEFLARDKVSLDIFWLRDDSLTDTDDLPPPAVLAAEIAEDLQAALDEIQALADALSAAEDSQWAESPRTGDPSSLES